MEPYSWLYSCLGCAALEWNDPIWAAPWQNQQCGCAPAKTQISLGIRPVWSESSLSTWGKLGSLATHWMHSEDSDQTGRMPRLIWVFAGRTHFVGFVMSWLISICLLYHVFCCCFYWNFTARRNYLTSFEQVGRKWKILKNITETYSFGNFRKLSLYNCFMPV